MDGHRMAHHAGGHGVGQPQMDGAHGPGVAQVIGAEAHLVAAELLHHPPPHLLQGYPLQVCGDGRPLHIRQGKVLHPFRQEGPNLVFPRFAGGQDPHHRGTTPMEG